MPPLLCWAAEAGFREKQFGSSFAWGLTVQRGPRRWCLLLSLPHLDLRPAKGLLWGAEGIPEGHGQSGDPDAHLKPQPLCLLSPWLLSSSPHSGARVSLPGSPGLRPLLPCLSARSENNCFLYGVFNGYDGNRVTNFVAQRLSAELLLGQLNAEHTEADVRRVLLQVPGSGRPTLTSRVGPEVLLGKGVWASPWTQGWGGSC